MNDVKAFILCNNPIAVPGIKEFLFYGNVAAIAIPKRNKEMQYILEQLMKDTEVPLILLDKKEYKTQLTNAMKAHPPTIALMMTFPFIIPADILAIPTKGFVNFHYGLLPQCRGPQPILWHLLNNDEEAGITLHKVDTGIDTGEIIIQEKIKIEERDTYGILQGKLAQLAAKAASNLLKILSYGSIIPSTRQDESKANYYEMPTANEVTINWNEMTAVQINRLVNACNPWNKGAGTTIAGWGILITETEILSDTDNNTSLPGTILACNRQDGLIVQTCDAKKLRINIVYLQEGIYSGWRLADFGVTINMQFGT